MTPSLSVILITRNEAQAIRRCLESVCFADEIIVLDSGSTDETTAICREYTDQVYVTDWPGFGVQKNRALAKASGQWVLSVDADEWVSPVLRDEILQSIGQETVVTAYQLPRRSTFCGRPMLHGGWWPDYVTRLFRNGAARFSDNLVHEALQVSGAVGTLLHPLEHETSLDLEETLHKMDAYSTAGAQMLLQRHKRASLATALGHGIWAFFRTYLLRRGFLDGQEGFMLAVSIAETTYYRYLKLMLLTDKKISGYRPAAKLHGKIQE